MTSNKQIGRSLLRIAFQTGGLFLLCNFFFWAAQPQLLDQLGRFSLYGPVFTPRDRLPYGEDIQASHNLTLQNLPAMMASHALSRPKPANEFRVVVLGDSATWGWRQEPDDTVVAQLNQHGLTTADGRQVVFYNLGYPVLSLTKDMLLLELTLAFDPDLIVWLITLESLALDQQTVHPLVNDNPHAVAAAGLPPPAVDPAPWWRETIVGRRRELADLLRLQFVGAAWSATGVDQHIPADYEPVSNDLKNDNDWHGLNSAAEMTAAATALPLLVDKINHTNVPFVVINEPQFIASGTNSDERYNSLYPKWAYDHYRILLRDELTAREMAYYDLWDIIPASEFTDSPVHLTPAGAHLFADQLIELLKNEVK